jgi:YD repeat-containing protein
MMKTKKLLIYTLIIIGSGGYAKAQNQFQGVNFGDMPRPVPSVSSYASYTDNPPSLALGIPELSIPLLELRAGTMNLGLQLSYNPLNASADQATGEAGTGWSLFRGGVISRQINGDLLDEAFQLTSNPNYEKNVFDDEYYYNLPGFSGKFKIERDTVQNTFRLIDLSPLNHIKIQYTRQSNQATLVIDSFTITDDQGNLYHFNDYSTAVLYDGFYTNKGLWGLEYKSAFFLTRITDAHGTDTANFTYRKDTKYDENNTLLYKTCLLEKMNTASGNIEMVYDYDQALEKTMNDPYSIKKVILNNAYTKTAEYAFEYSYPVPPYPAVGTDKRRQLERIKKMNGPDVPEQTSFLYYALTDGTAPTAGSCGGSVPVSPSGVLYKIIYPTKGVTEYSYENAETFVDKNNAAYLENLMQDYTDPCIQYQQNLLGFNFNTAQTHTYSFTIPGDPTKKKAFWVNYNDYYTSVDPNTGMPVLLPPVPENKRITYTLKKGNEVLAGNQKGSNVRFYHYPGQYTVEVTVPNLNGEVNFELLEVLRNPGPYRNARAEGKYRIRSVKSYGDTGSTVPAKTALYSYDDFLQPNSSSGYPSFGGDILYKNVRLTDGSGNGYVRYWFKTNKDYPAYTIPKNGGTASFQPYYNLLRSGILEKKEIFSEAHQLMAAESHEYTFAAADDADYLTDDGYYSKTAWTSYSKQVSTVYPSGNTASQLQTVSEHTVRADNYKISASKTSSPDGTVTETAYRYAQDKNISHLVASNMTGIPVETEVKKNGKLMGKTETKFDLTSSRHPSSVTQANPNDGSVKTAVKYDLYDDRGNIVQYTTDIDPLTGKGNPVTIIWGYNKTLPVARLTGAQRSDVGTLADDIVAKSDADSNDAKEKELLTALDAFRNHEAFKKFQVTTYSYDPLIGITTLTPPTGLREFYQYDSFGRLISVKDSNGNMVKEVKYNNKQ